ncbi:MAG: TIGR03118 family protein [Planctomycetia bacterium 21-64-5]|nr:MAG: TIGR03118 family protein [Planctomycetia bacterium 21-64-5]HQU42470.1 TIGR03118 family protein [Pirellulales bacterium]
MLRWNAIRSPWRRSSPGTRLSNSRRPRRRLLESLETRWLLASDAYLEINLASNQPGAALVTDPSLAFAWGIAASPGASGGFSVSDSAAGRSNFYSGDVAGSPFVKNADQAVDVPSPTGQVYNGNANEFIIHSPPPPPGVETPIFGGPAEFLYASLDGTIYGFNSNVGPQAVAAVSVPGAGFTGLTLANSVTTNSGSTSSGTGDQLYAADFLGGKIDVFDASFQPVTTSGSFTDPNLPTGYKPFNVQALGGELYVSYTAWLGAAQEVSASGPLPPTPAPGGVIDAFDASGNFLGRIASGAPLDQPWGMALAPQSFGQFAGDLLVAKQGNGEINAFNPGPSPTATGGTSLGALDGPDGNPLIVNGLLGLAFGNGDNAGDADSLYFTAGFFPDLVWPFSNTSGGPAIATAVPAPELSHGLFGAVQVAGTGLSGAVGTDTTAQAGREFSGALAAFGSAELPSPEANPVASYTATIDWGDGSSTTPGTVVPTGNGGYLVVGSHTYTAAATDDYQVTINDASGNSATVTGTVQVMAATLSAKALPVESHGLSIDNANVAAFIDTGGADPLSNYSATIDWGDGTSATPGTITQGIVPPDAVPIGGYFAVAGSHTYAATGDYTFTVTISDSDGTSATVHGAVDIAAATLNAHALPVVSDGLVVDNADVAAFLDTGGADPLSNYSATIDWGDGSTSAGTIDGGITATPAIANAVGGYFSVAGSHTYTATGDYTFAVTISDTDGGSATVTGTVVVAQATLQAKAIPVDSTGLTVNNATVADFIDTGAGDPLSNYKATIDWGDGTPASAGTITGIALDDGTGGGSLTAAPAVIVGGEYYRVEGSHTYAASGDYTTTITISDSDGTNATVQGTVDVAQATLEAKALPVVSQGLNVSNATLADFIDTGGADPLTNYSATINWGDGSSSTGTVGAGVTPVDASMAGGYFTVAGSHTYAATGSYTFTVTISDTDGITTTAKGTIDLGQAPLLAVGVPVVVTSGLSVDGAIVAAFADTKGGDALANYSATIDWGDGSSTAAGTVAGSDNSFIVTGSHTYAASGDYELKVALVDTDGSTANVTAHAFLDSPVASVVATAFQDVLHRAADDSGLSYWTQQIAGGLPPSQFASDLTHSAEFYATNVIDPAYQTYLGRGADAAGVAYWTSQMQQGLTDQEIEANFIASPEFYAHAGGTDAAWVNAMYQTVLGRPADSAGLNYWTNQLAGGASRSSVAMGFAASQEREAQTIQNDYFTYLGRTASPAEVNYWVAQFDQGSTNEDIVSAFIGSSEYFKVHS